MPWLDWALIAILVLETAALVWLAVDRRRVRAQATAPAPEAVPPTDTHLSESAAIYQSVVEYQTDLICRYLPDTTLTFVNDAYSRFWGKTRDELLGTKFLTFIPESAHPAVLSQVASIVDHPAVQSHEHEVVLQDGKIGWQHWINRPIVDADGKVTELQAIGRDITDRRRAEEELRNALADVKRLSEQLHAENLYLQDELTAAERHGDLVCRSETMRARLAEAGRVAPTMTPVLITGETGTGKEVLARALHSMSGRRDRPFVRVNCAALPASLIESELFGHERGAFTGAVSRRAGRFELADGGTLFLDEIGELPIELQPKLLRVLQESEFERVGSSRTVRVSVRILAATNRDLAAAVAAGTFRADLYYRLNVFPIHVPPLRERVEDIGPLASTFLRQACRRVGREIDGISRETFAAFEAYDWPGNVRELQNVIERATVTTRGHVLRLPDDWAGALAFDAERASALQATGTDGAVAHLSELERQHILNALRHTHWRIDGHRGAAALLGVKPSTLRSKMARLGILGPGSRDGGPTAPMSS